MVRSFDTTRRGEEDLVRAILGLRVDTGADDEGNEEEMEIHGHSDRPSYIVFRTNSKMEGDVVSRYSLPHIKFLKMPSKFNTLITFLFGNFIYGAELSVAFEFHSHYKEEKITSPLLYNANYRRHQRISLSLPGTLLSQHIRINLSMQNNFI